MPEPVLVAPPGPSEIAAARRLDQSVLAATAHEALPSAVWRDLEHPTADSALVLDGPPETSATVVHVAPSDTFAPQHWQLAVAAEPTASQRRLTASLETAVEFIAERGGTSATLWIPGADDSTDHLLTPIGFVLVHEQFQMRVPLPLDEQPQWPEGVTVRAFGEPGDERAWLTVNNRSFANHPDQGGWIEETMHRRMAEPWFDPAGLLLAFDSAGLAGSCWTKVHPATDREPALGEIFVIGVDPDRQGTGLGRALVLGGLDHLAAERGCTVGILYVDAANAPALTLYESLGFTVHRTDRAYECAVPSRS
jgi:mycothiol synthase